MATDPTGEISELKSKLASVEAVLGPDAMRKEADGLRDRLGEPGFWNDQEQAQAVTRRMSYLDNELGRLENLHRRLDDTKVLFELAESEHDEAASATAPPWLPEEYATTPRARSPASSRLRRL